MSVTNLTNKNCCPDNKDSIFSFIAGGISNQSGTKEICLADIMMSRCSPSISCLDIKPNESMFIDASLIVLSSAGNKFLVTNDASYKSNNSEIIVDYTSVVDGDIENFTVSVEFNNILEESLFNWNNFHNKPYNTGITNWDEVEHSWEFYSTTNSTTNHIIVENYLTENLEIQVVGGVDTEKTFEFIDNNGNTLTLTLKYSGGTITVESITVTGSVTIDEIQITPRTIVAGSSTYDIFFRGMVVFDEVEHIFIANYTKPTRVLLHNHNSETITFNTLTGLPCEEETVSEDCCCS